MTQQTIAFIGGGNMATSLVAGLIADGFDPACVVVSDPDEEKRRSLEARFGVRATPSNAAAVDLAGTLVLCVKPQIAPGVCRDLAASLKAPLPLIISVMAGIREQTIQDWLAVPAPVVRAMPNTPAMMQAGAIGLHASPEVSSEQCNRAETILRAGGLVRWVDREALIDVVTALSGSGPAYFFLLMEAMEQVASELGLDAETARLLTIQTALGAARMAMESDDPPQVLRERVTSPGGTTEQALDVFHEGNFRDLVRRAMGAAKRRAETLSEELAAIK